MDRVKFFIDGFNLYHVLDNREEYHKYKWLDFSKLANCFMRSDEEIVGILYFTALAYWNTGKVERHKTFIKALRTKGVKPILGQFQTVTKKCRGNCKDEYVTHEEKKTDVNIACEVLKSAFQDEFDTAAIVSADSDMVPIIETLKFLYPAKKVKVIIPITARAYHLIEASDFHMKIKEKHLRSCLFPDEIDLGDGNKIIKPVTWL
jgi:uncharacterized LabA/DUF88 family protein